MLKKASEIFILLASLVLLIILAVVFNRLGVEERFFYLPVGAVFLLSFILFWLFPSPNKKTNLIWAGLVVLGGFGAALLITLGVKPGTANLFWWGCLLAANATRLAIGVN